MGAADVAELAGLYGGLGSIGAANATRLQTDMDGFGPWPVSDVGLPAFGKQTSFQSHAELAYPLRL